MPLSGNYMFDNIHLTSQLVSQILCWIAIFVLFVTELL